jgi:hypothetical protein
VSKPVYSADPRCLDPQDDSSPSAGVLGLRNTLDCPDPVKLPLERLTGSPLLGLGKHLDLQITYCGHEPGLHDISILLVFRKVSYRIDLYFRSQLSLVPNHLFGTYGCFFLRQINPHILLVGCHVQHSAFLYCSVAIAALRPLIYGLPPVCGCAELAPLNSVYTGE